MYSAVRKFLALSLAAAWLMAWGNRSLNEDLFLAFCAGRDTVAGLVAQPDRWSFTTNGAIWIDQSWLSHVIYYLAYLKLAELGPVLVQGVLLAGCVAILVVRCMALGASVEVALFATTLGTLSFAPFMGIRAENFGMFYCLVLTSFLVAPDSWGRWRQIGAVLVLAAWANSHGSFMLGFVLVCTRFCVETISACVNPVLFDQPVLEAVEPGGDTRDKQPSRLALRCNRDIKGWFVAAVVAVPVMAFVNPYGPDNLRIPFRQLTASSVTAQWVDWMPLLDFSTLFQQGLFKPLSAEPFLCLSAFVGLMLAAVPFSPGFQQVVRFLALRASSFASMEVAAAIVMLPLVIRFRRMMLFAAPAFVPIAAVLMQIHLESFRNRVSGPATKTYKRILFTAALAWTALLVFFLYHCTVVPQLPGNPLALTREERPLVSGLMSHDMVWAGVAQFLKQNGIQGRVFTNVVASDYLLFNIPELKLFFDLRAQSLYPDEIIRDYVSIMTGTQETVGGTVALLERSGVEILILDTVSESGFGDAYIALATRLMETKEWACIYRDDNVFVLVRTNSERFGSIVEKGDLGELLYADQDTRTVSRAFLHLFMKGGISETMVSELERVLRHHPSPSIYRLVLSGLNGSSQCLNGRAASFVLSEIKRLSGSNYMRTAGAPAILSSLWELLDVVERNEMTCGTEIRTAFFRQEKLRVRQVFEEIRRQYDGL
ncbi:MAG TPA: hypothetical protein VK463_08325 [Desulfomonilaceae bacterium]|nr:hypothetical protein [Desulfomonilaceae bacterium]